MDSSPGSIEATETSGTGRSTTVPAERPTTSRSLERSTTERIESASSTAATTGGRASGSSGSDGGGPRSGAPRSNSGSGGSSAGYTGLLGTYGVDELLWGQVGDLPAATPGTHPLTGIPGNASASSAVIVKVDNSRRARPHVGLTRADIVFEEEVEGGITRLAAVFHSQQGVVGPVRSGRTTDISFMNSFGPAAYVYSGANRVTDALLTGQPAPRTFSAASSGGFWRQSGRRAPSNLFTDTTRFVGSGAPPAQFFHGPPSSGTPVSQLSISYPGTTVGWSWTGGAWARSQDGSVHESDGVGVTAGNVVVAVVPEAPTGMRDSAGYPVPEFVFAGQGPVSVFTNGQRVDGTWTRSTLRQPAVLLDASGEPIVLSSGNTWIEMVSPGSYRSG